MDDNKSKVPTYVGEEALNELINMIYDLIKDHSPSISVETDTDTEYVLRITNPNGSSFLTPNLIRTP